MNQTQRAAVRRVIKEKGALATAKAAGVAELTLLRVLEDEPTVNVGSVRLIEHFADDLLRKRAAESGPDIVAAAAPEGAKAMGR